MEQSVELAFQTACTGRNTVHRTFLFNFILYLINCKSILLVEAVALKIDDQYQPKVTRIRFGEVENI